MKKISVMLVTLLLALGCISCTSPSNSSTSEYLLCNATSGGGRMSEIESGFFYQFEQILYYADKADMNKWVPVCNKPDCVHIRNTSPMCNANIYYEITQKGENLYYFTQEMNKILIYQVSKDVSVGKVVYELSLEEEGEIYVSRGIISQSYFLFAYICLDENGNYTRNLIRLDEDGTIHKLFSEITDSEATLGITWPASFQAVRGEEAIIADFLVKDGTYGQNVLWKVKGDTPERVNLPEDVSILYSYLTEEIFTYYKSGEGFYQIDLESGEETLIMENQLEDGRGYILTDECMIECNRYNGYTPEEAHLKVYNGEEWLDVSLPEEIAKLDCNFNPTAIASDRIFFVQSKIGDMASSNHQLYYMMLNDDTPELVYCYTFGDDSCFEIPEETVKDTDGFEDVIVFDTNEYLIKITDTNISKIGEKEFFEIKMYYENRTDDKDYYFVLQEGAVNGIECSWNANTSLKAGESKEYTFSISETNAKFFGIYDIYTMEEYTDISFLIVVEDEDISYKYDSNIGRYDPATGKKPEQKIVGDLTNWFLITIMQMLQI